jgi:aspartate 1-decarboxylase
MRWVLRSKIHKATVTGANVNYIGSITIDIDLIEKAGFWPGEKVLVVSNTTGQRLETYVMTGGRGSGAITMNGAAALTIKAGEEIIIMGFELVSEPAKPTIVLVDGHNKFQKFLKAVMRAFFPWLFIAGSAPAGTFNLRAPLFVLQPFQLGSHGRTGSMPDFRRG